MPNSKDSQTSPKPLEPTLRHQLECKLGTDLSNIRVVQNNVSSGSDAKSFAQGNTIYINANAVDPNSKSGQEVIAQEATHIVQQRSNNTAVNETYVNRVKTSDKQQAAVLNFIKG